MTTFKHLRRFVSRSFCVRSSSAVALNNTPDLVSKPKLNDVLPVQTLDHTTQKGEHYQRSYRQFTSLLNSGGHAEVFEGCIVVGKVVKVINKEVIETQSSVKKLVALQYQIDKLLERRASGQYPEQVARIEEEIALKQEELQLRKLANQSETTHRLFEDDWNIENVLVVDWGHKHLGYAPLDCHQVCPGHSEYVACRLHKFELTALALGHPVHERHNEAQLEYIKPARQVDATETPSLRPLVRNAVFPNIYTNRYISPPLSDVYIDHSYTNHFTENAILSSCEAEVSWSLEDDVGIDGKLRIRIKSESLEHIFAAVSMINHEIEVYENYMDQLEKVDSPEDTSLGDEKTEGVTQVLETLQDFDNICVDKGTVKSRMETLLIYVDNAHTIQLMGKERPNIYSIGKKSKTFLKIISDGEVEKEEKRQISIKGKDRDAVFVAVDMINKYIDEYKKQDTKWNTQSSKDPLKDLQADDSATTITNAAQLIELQDYEHVYVDRNNISSRLTGSHIQISHIFVDDCYISPVIEKKKSLIRNLSKSSLIVLSESDVPAGMAKIQIRSTVKNRISLAAGVVNKHIEMYENSGEKNNVIPRRELGDSLDLLEGHSFIYIDKDSLVPRSVEIKAQDIYIDKPYVAMVIGRKGATINDIREKSHALIDVGSTFLEKKQKITISSENEEDISVAIGLINDKLSQFVKKQSQK